MQMIENRAEWRSEFEANWLAHLNETGEMLWKIYNYAKPEHTPSSQGVDVTQSKVMLITSAGSYLRDDQSPFNASDPRGDYTIRTYASNTPLDALAFAHDHYDHTAVMKDPQVLVPLEHLQFLAEQGEIGSFADTVISYSGYQPEITRIEDDLLPSIRAVLADVKPDAVLLVPS